jgi:hypothetical protein
MSVTVNTLTTLAASVTLKDIRRVIVHATNLLRKFQSMQIKGMKRKISKKIPTT